MSGQEWSIVAGVIIALALALVTTFCTGYRVEIDGHIVGYLKNAETFTQSLAQAETNLQEQVGSESAYIANDLELKRTLLIGADELDAEALTQALDDTDLAVAYHGVELVVDGVSAGNFPTETEAQDAVQEALNRSVELKENESITSADIKSEIVTTPKDFPQAELDNRSSTAHFLLTGQKYATQQSDKNLLTASRGGTVTEGPQEPETTIGEGEYTGIIKASVAKQTLVQEELPYSIENADGEAIAAEEAAGDKMDVTQAGETGLKEKAVECLYENGKLVSQKILTENIVKEPVKQVVEEKKASSTNTQANLSGTTRGSIANDYILPASGLITALDKEGSHAGCFAVDIANAEGTPILAPASGTVIMTQNYYGYGQTVQIQADDGAVFLLGHNSAYNCSVGDRVSQGDVVAYMGSTGWSTGPHCHFEILIGGVKQYLPSYFAISEGMTV